MSDQPTEESLPEQVELSYDGSFDVDADTYVITARIGDTVSEMRIPVSADVNHVATLLASLPAVVDAVVEAIDQHLEGLAEEQEAAIEHEPKHRGIPVAETEIVEPEPEVEAEIIPTVIAGE